jgi:hypothetical protein
MLKLRRAKVIDAGPVDGPEQDLTIELDGRSRPAIADVALVGAARTGDEVIVNTQALDLGLGSGGFDIVHVNLTHGLDGDGGGAPRPDGVVGQGAPCPDGVDRVGASAMKLNYTSMQHAVSPVEDQRLSLPLQRPVAVLALHGQLAPVVWAFVQAVPGGRLGYVQTEGGALSGGHSRTVRSLRERGLLAGHLTAGAAFGGEGEAITTAGALHHGLGALGWDAAVCGPGPGIVGSSSPLGHGGLSALDSAHAALALGCAALLVARMSSGDPRARHRGISHHTLTVLDLLLAPVTVALPAGMRSPVGADLLAGLRSVGLGTVFGGAISSRPGLELDVERPTARGPASLTRHDWRRATVDLPAYAASGLPAQTMGRGLTEDPLFFGSALAGGSALAELVAQAPGNGAVDEHPGEHANRSPPPPAQPVVGGAAADPAAAAVCSDPQRAGAGGMDAKLRM